MSQQRQSPSLAGDGRGVWPPIVYGHPDWIETYLISVRKVLDCQPDDVFAHGGVRRAGSELTALIERRSGDEDDRGRGEGPASG